ncbi:MAG: 3-deoxy-D-manno-octulosonic acid transferase [Verrucomicrobiota bacterium]
MRLLYNILFIVFFCLSAPYYFLKMWRRGNWRAGFGQRFGDYSGHEKSPTDTRRTLWLHAVSVGEVNVCAQLIRELEPRLPDWRMVVSTTTSTGMGLLKDKLPEHIEKIYYPIDRRRFVRRAFAAIQPDAIGLIEAEIWPNFLWHAIDRKLPLFLINARLSEKSYRGYRRFDFLFRELFAGFTGVGAQDKEDAARLCELGFRKEAVHTFSNLKFDAVRLPDKKRVDVPAMLRQLGVPDGAPVLVGGSTHRGEEAMLGQIAQRLRQKHPHLFLVLAPRHFERTKQVEQELREAGVRHVCRTDVTPERKFTPGEVDCLLVNTTGELLLFYEQATVVFVGKSISAKGGQSPIEPGALGKAMVFGPNMQNFEAIARTFVAGGGAVQVADAAELERALDELLANAERRAELGRNALQVVHQSQGATARTVEMMVEQLGRK